MLEQYIPGHEISVVVTGPHDAPAVAGATAVVAAISTSGPDTGLWTRSFAPASDIPPTIEQLALDAYAAIGVLGGASVDFVVDPDGNPWILEVDTALDFTPRGIVACAAASAGSSSIDVMQKMFESIDGPPSQQ
jgi:D-alanine-D-alanine ligase